MIRIYLFIFNRLKDVSVIVIFVKTEKAYRLYSVDDNNTDYIISDNEL